MMNIYKSIFEKLVFLHYDENALYFKPNHLETQNHFDALTEFEQYLVKMMLQYRCIKHYGQTEHIYKILSMFFYIHDGKLKCGFDWYKITDQLFTFTTYSYIMNELEEFFYYYEHTDNV